MKIQLIRYCSILVLALSVGTSNAKDLPIDGAPSVSAEQSSPKTYSTLGFKGLHLGMTRKEIVDIGWDKSRQDWQLTSGIGLDKKEHIFFTTETPIGCVGEGDAEICYPIELVAVRFFEDKVIGITIHGPSVMASQIFSTKDWIKFAYISLKKKYGQPTKIYANPDKLSVLSIHNIHLLYGWKLKKEILNLSVGESEFKFLPIIEMVDASAEEVIRKSRTQKIRSEL